VKARNGLESTAVVAISDSNYSNIKVGPREVGIYVKTLYCKDLVLYVHRSMQYE
jgi:hypothetical protein